jgi:hypothetical protein
MDNKTWTIIVLASVLIGIGLYFGINYYHNIAYSEGATDALDYLNKQITTEVLQTGSLSLVIPYQNKTFQVKMIINQTEEING